MATCSNRFNKSGMHVTYFDSDWNRMPVHMIGETEEPAIINKPAQLKQIVSFTEQLSVSIPFVRVDFVISNNNLYFSELTFFDSGGRKPFVPQEFELQCGEWIKLPPKMR